MFVQQDMGVLVVPGDVGVPRLAEVAHAALLHVQLGVAVLVDQQFGQLIETLATLQALEGGGGGGGGGLL